MPFEWDETKREVNIRKHGVDFVLVEGFNMETAMQVPDLRYDEPRVRAYGYIGDRMHVLGTCGERPTSGSSACAKPIEGRRCAMPPLKPGHISPAPEEDEAINMGIASDPENPEWAEEDFARARPMAEADPELVAMYRAGKLTLPPHARREHPKTRVTIRLDADVVARLRADGPGWQTRANAALREAVLGR